MWIVSVRTVSIMILDSGRLTSTEIRCVKTLTIVCFVTLFEQFNELRQDASENPMRTISVERLVLNVLVGESGDRLISTRLLKQGSVPKRDHHTCCVGKTAERSSPNSCDGVDHERRNVFDECVKFGKEIGTFDPTTVACCPNVGLMARKAMGVEKSISALVAWPSGEGQLHGVKFLFVQGGHEMSATRQLL